MAAQAATSTAGGTPRTGVLDVVRRCVAVGALVTVGSVAGSAAGAALLPAGAAAAVAPSASRCADETSLWTGDATVAPGGSFDTGTDVGAAGAGVELTVVGVSADGLDAEGRARPLVVQVGGVAAVAGTSVAGGRISASHPSDGSGPLRVVGVSVVVRRCTVVASAPAPDAPIVSGPAGSGVATVRPTAAALLPETGGTPWTRSIVGSLLVAVGAAMVSFGRRRESAQPAAVPTTAGPAVTAGDREPGSLLAAAPHAPR